MPGLIADQYDDLTGAVQQVSPPAPFCGRYAAPRHAKDSVEMPLYGTDLRQWNLLAGFTHVVLWSAVFTAAVYARDKGTSL